MKLTKPLKYHGGKHYLAARIVALFPKKYLSYIEPYAGGLSVLLEANPDGVNEIVNDINRQLIDFWRVLQHERLFPLFVRRCQATPFSQEEWERIDYLKDMPIKTVHGDERAWEFFVHCRQSLAGRMNSFAPISTGRTRRGMNEQVSAWLNAVEGLPEVHARLKRVLILNDDALQVIVKYDHRKSFFYLDPPYLQETRVSKDAYGQYEMDYEQHNDLLDVLCKLKGKFILSGYRSKLYDLYARKNGWRRVDVKMPNNAAGGKQKRVMTESLWMNY